MVPQAESVIIVNIPAFQLYAWSAEDRGKKPTLSMRVVVGRAARSKAPLITGAIEHLVFRPCNAETLEPSRSTFMVNYRVDDLAALLQALRDERCDVLERTEDSEFGKFGWVMDPEGNRVELWQPPPGQ